MYSGHLKDNGALCPCEFSVPQMQEIKLFFEMALCYGDFSSFFLRKQAGRPGLAHWRGPKAEAPAWKDVDEDEATGSFFAWEIAVRNERLNGNVPCIRRGCENCRGCGPKDFLCCVS